LSRSRTNDKVFKSLQMNPIPLLPNNFYHIYNCGINGTNLFNKSEDYEFFLKKYAKYISPVADTYAWCLMPNHFHVLIRIKENVVYKYSNADRSIDAVRWNEVKWETYDLSANLAVWQAYEASDSVKIPLPDKHFSHLFNTHARYFNTKYNRHGALFERPFKRKLIEHETYFQNLIVYINCNAVHHGFCEHPIEYPWSSYHSVLCNKPTRLKREKVLDWFEDKKNFKHLHLEKVDFFEMDEWLGV